MKKYLALILALCMVLSLCACGAPKTEAPYVCIEPWFGLDDDVFATGKIEEKKGIVKLPAKETFKFAVTIEPQY